MAHVKVTVDGKVEMNGDLGQWTSTPPALVRDSLKRGARPSLWMRCLLLFIADVGMTNNPITVTITTRPDGADLSYTDPSKRQRN